MRSNTQLVRCLLAGIAGMFIPLGFSPFDLWFAPILGMAAVFAVVRNQPTRMAIWQGLCFGLSMFGFGTSWIYVSIHEFGSAPPSLAGLLTGLFVLAIALLMIVPIFALYGWLINKRKPNDHVPWQQAILFSGLWVLFEWVRSWLLTGFPWLFNGYALLDTPYARLAPVVGVFGLSLLMVSTATTGVAMLVSRMHRQTSMIAFAVTLFCWGSALPLRGIQWTKPSDVLPFSAVQGNIPQNLKWDPVYIDQTLRTYLSLSSDQWSQPLVIWPENSIPVPYSQITQFLGYLDHHAKINHSTLLLGMPVDDKTDGETRYFNSVLLLGDSAGNYQKQKLVPFGEYVPLQSWLRGMIAFFDLPMSDFSAGSSAQQPLLIDGIKVAPYICYEIAYPDFVANFANNTGLLITVSNDTWFGHSIGPLQHFQIARMRALETGRSLIRATNDGLTALVDYRGRIVKEIPRFQTGVLTAVAEIRQGKTPFMVLGSWPTILLSLLMVSLASGVLKKAPSPYRLLRQR